MLFLFCLSRRAENLLKGIWYALRSFWKRGVKDLLYGFCPIFKNLSAGGLGKAVRKAQSILTRQWKSKEDKELITIVSYRNYFIIRHISSIIWDQTREKAINVVTANCLQSKIRKSKTKNKKPWKLFQFLMFLNFPHFFFFLLEALIKSTFFFSF